MDAAEAEPKAGAFSTLSTEQLLDYIKKQKIRIKRLEKEKETFTKQDKILTKSSEQAASVPSTANPALFWDLIDRESPFMRKIAKTALSMLTSTLSKSTVGKNFQPSKKSLFDRWRSRCVELRAEHAIRDAVEANKPSK